jgi:lysophospholipase L1-like esterase
LSAINLRSCCALGVFLALSVIGSTARADVLHGIGINGDGGESNPSTLKPAGIMASQRGLNFGPSMSYNVAQIGATAASILNSGNQIDQLKALANSGDVTLVLMSLGDNDWFPQASNIASGGLSGTPLTTFSNGIVNNIKSGVDQVLATGAKVALGGFSNIVDSPAAASIAADPTAKARVENALEAADNQLIAYAASKGIPFVDFFHLEKQVYDSGSFVVGGVNINLHTTGSDPHNFFQDNLNAGVIIRAEVANLWMQAINQGYGTNLALLTDHEILTLAGIGNEFVAETFAPNVNFSSFVVPAPEPSSWVLMIVAAAVLAVCSACRKTNAS